MAVVSPEHWFFDLSTIVRSAAVWHSGRTDVSVSIDDGSTGGLGGVGEWPVYSWSSHEFFKCSFAGVWEVVVACWVTNGLRDVVAHSEEGGHTVVTMLSHMAMEQEVTVVGDVHLCVYPSAASYHDGILPDSVMVQSVEYW